MVIKDGQKWRMVRSWNIKGWTAWMKDDKGNRIWEGFDNIPDYFITINGRVPKNMSGKGADTFELWPVKHHGRYRYSGMTYYDYKNSHGYYYSVKEYTYWDGYLHSRTHYYWKDAQIEYIEKRMNASAQAHAEYKENGEYKESYVYNPPFATRFPDSRFVNARYSVKP